MLWWKKSPTNLRAPGWHYFPLQLASRPQMGGVEINMGFQWKWLQLTGCFKTTVRDWDLEIGKTRHFETHSLYIWVFTGLQLSSTHNFLFETSIKIGVKSHFKTKKNINSSTPSKVHFHPPKNVGSQKIFIKNSWKPLRSEPFRPLHWIHPLDIHGQSATSELPAWSMEIPRPPVGNAAVDLIQWVGFSRFETQSLWIINVN